jgi:thiol:disulfide interchange protein DsbA
MNRRTSISAIALGSASCPVAFKALAQDSSLAKPDKGGRPFRSVNVTEDGRRVVFFFDFACPYCASYHAALSNFARTVPKNIQALFIPVVNIADTPRKDEQILAAKLFYGASAVGTPDQMTAFVGSVYASYAESRSLMNKAMWLNAVNASGINKSKFAAAINADSIEVRIRYAARKLVQYGVSATPSVAVGGKYILTPEDVMGDQQMFFNIINGLTSEIL